VEWSDTARYSDADFEDVMNLFFSLQQDRYVYPKIEMVQASLTNHRPKVIIIGDSFFWQIKGLKDLMYIFSEDSKYWYYFKKSFPLSDEAGSDMKFLDVVQELQSADFVILLGSMGTLGEFPFGVTDYFQDNISNNDIIQGNGGKQLKFNLKAANGKYISEDETQGNILIANRDSAAEWETFYFLNLRDKNCAIRSSENKYVSAELSKSNEITATRDKIADWETFAMVKIDSTHVAFKAANGKYLSLDKTTLQIFARGDVIGKDETFEMIEK
jgi:hypothetical protein